MGANQSQEQMLGPKPHVIYCKTCNETKLSKIEYVNGSNGWSLCIMLSFCWIVFSVSMFSLLFKHFTWDKFFELSAYLLIIGLVLIPCCILPFFWNNCKDREHYCTQCDTYIGKYKAGSGQNYQMMGHNHMMYMYIPPSS